MIRTSFYCLTFLFSLLAFYSHASPLEDAIDLLKHQPKAWSHMNLDLWDIEQYQHRHMHFDPNFLKRWHDKLTTSTFIHQHHHSLSLEPDAQAPHLMQDADELAEFLALLPEIQVTSYAAMYLKPEVINKLQMNSFYYEEGFLHSSADLAHSYQHVLTLPRDPAYERVIMQIDGYSAKLCDLLFQQAKADILYNRRQTFQVYSKSYDANEHIYRLHLRQVRPEHMPPHKLKVSARSGKLYPIAQTTCTI